MVLNSNRKNVAKIAAASSSMVLLMSSSYQLNDDVQDGSFVMENVRDGLKSNICGSGFLGALKIAGISVKKRICTGLNKVVTPIISKIPSLQKITSTCRKLWKFSDDENLIRIVKFIPEYLRKPNNKNKRILASEKQLVSVEDAEEILASEKQLVSVEDAEAILASEKQLVSVEDAEEILASEKQLVSVEDAEAILERIKAAIRTNHLIFHTSMNQKDWSVYVSLCEEDPNMWIKDQLTENEATRVIREIALYSDVSCLENIVRKIDSDFELVSECLQTEVLDYVMGDIEAQLQSPGANSDFKRVTVEDRFKRLLRVISSCMKDNNLKYRARENISDIYFRCIEQCETNKKYVERLKSVFI